MGHIPDSLQEENHDKAVGGIERQNGRNGEGETKRPRDQETKRLRD
jgi:hypothetical protein